MSKKWALIFVCIVCLIAMTGCAFKTESAYDKATKLLAQGKYSEAALAFDNLSEYPDSNMYATYARGLNAGETGDYELALQTFELLGDFKDSALQLKYYQARGYESQDDFWSFSEAISIYEEMRAFRDSSARIENINSIMKDRYNDAFAAGKKGEFDKAIDAFYNMNGYEQSNEYYMYYSALKAEQEQDYSLSYLANLKSLGDFESSREHFVTFGNSILDSLSVGDVVYYGYDMYDWYVLDIDREGRRILLIRAGTVNYDLTFGRGDATICYDWEDSIVREWLNDSYNGFLGSYFSENEATLIDTTRVQVNSYKAIQPKTEYVSEWSPNEVSYYYPEAVDSINGVEVVSKDKEVYDKVFALSTEEVLRYLEPLGIQASDNEYWLRDAVSLIYFPDFGMRVYTDVGSAFSVNTSGQLTYTHNRQSGSSGTHVARPAIWLNLN